MGLQSKQMTSVNEFPLQVPSTWVSFALFFGRSFLFSSMILFFYVSSIRRSFFLWDTQIYTGHVNYVASGTVLAYNVIVFRFEIKLSSGSGARELVWAFLNFRTFHHLIIS